MTRMLPKGKKGFLKNPVQASRERTVLTQYDREGFEIPCFQNSQLSVTTVQNRIKSKKPGKFQMFIALIELVINMIITVITTCFPFMRFSGLVHLLELVFFSTTSG